MHDLNNRFFAFCLDFRRVFRMVDAYTQNDKETLNSKFALQLQEKGFSYETLLKLMRKKDTDGLYNDKSIEDLLNTISMKDLCTLIVKSEKLLNENSKYFNLLIYLINDSVVNLVDKENIFLLCDYLLTNVKSVRLILKDYIPTDIAIDKLNENEMLVFKDFIYLISTNTYDVFQIHKLFGRLSGDCSTEEVDHLEIYFLSLLITTCDSFSTDFLDEDKNDSTCEGVRTVSIRSLVNHYLSKIYSKKEVDASFNKFRKAYEMIDEE